MYTKHVETCWKILQSYQILWWHALGQVFENSMRFTFKNRLCCFGNKTWYFIAYICEYGNTICLVRLSIVYLLHWLIAKRCVIEESTRDCMFASVLHALSASCWKLSVIKIWSTFNSNLSRAKLGIANCYVNQHIFFHNLHYLS